MVIVLGIALLYVFEAYPLIKLAQMIREDLRAGLDHKDSFIL